MNSVRVASNRLSSPTTILRAPRPLIITMPPPLAIVGNACAKVSCMPKYLGRRDNGFRFFGATVHLSVLALVCRYSTGCPAASALEIAFSASEFPLKVSPQSVLA
jgi:hypothetical protein